MYTSTGPRWAKSSYPHIVGEDHLGIKYVSVLIAGRLQAGITTITPRARYWSFFTWVLHDFIQSQEERSMDKFLYHLKRQEWYFILANIAEASDRGLTTRQLIGVTKGNEVWDRDDQSIPIRYDYVKSSLGGYSIYRNVIKILGFMREGDIEKGVEVDRITPTGRKLAEAFAEEIKDTEYYRQWRHTNDPIPRAALLEFGKQAGLARLSKNSRDWPLLTETFLPSDSQEEHHKLRCLSLLYYQFIISMRDFAPGISSWREMMYDVFFPRAESAVTVPDALQIVAVGWEIYHGRQIFTFSLETIWSYLLELLARRSYTATDLIETMIGGLNQRVLETKLEDLLNSLPLDRNVRENNLFKMRKGGGEPQDYVWQPLVTMLDVYVRFKERTDFLPLHEELIRMGESDHISLKKWADDIEKYKGFSAKDFLRYIIRYYVIEQHQKVALNKILSTRNETYHFAENEGKLFYISPDKPSFNAFRIGQAVSVLEDLNLIKRVGGTYTMVKEVGE